VNDAPDYRCGFVAVVGRPNVGKSTLINALVGSKISIVSPKPQTTRHRILAVHTSPGCQLIFVDTPGLHRKAGKAMNRLMNRTATSALADADIVLLVCEAGRWTDEDQDVLDRIVSSGSKAIAVMNKIDLVKPKNALLQYIAQMSERHEFAEIIPLSAKRDDNLDRLMTMLPDSMPLSPALFPDDMLTDKSDMFLAAEMVREKLTILLRDELPYGLTVQIERYEQDEGGVTIHAIIWVERDSQKGIVIGKKGALLKQVGRSARIDIAKRLRVPVHLELWVKVKDNWANNEKDLQNLGYESP
jgi:GTP-binding protein Era